MKILLVCMKYYYGNKNQGYSYEWAHFYLGLKPKFDDLFFFDFLEQHDSVGQEKMQENLLALIKKEKPDITLFSLYTDQFTTQFIKGLSAFTKTLCFFHDDGWRREFSLKWAPCFDAFTTSDPVGVRKYNKLELANAVFVPFGVNEHLFHQNEKIKKDIDVSFIGAWHPYRQWLVEKIQKQGISMAVYGLNWPKGMLSEKEMVNVFQRSKISINMTNCPSWDLRYLLSSPRALINRFRSPKVYEQIKGRHFEIPACGTLQMSYYVDGLEKLFDLGNEILIYQNPEELVDKIKLYLNDPEELTRITQNGFKRVLKDHTYKKRFLNVFKSLGWMDK